MKWPSNLRIAPFAFTSRQVSFNLISTLLAVSSAHGTRYMAVLQADV
jgi:hypothetical protein